MRFGSASKVFAAAVVAVSLGGCEALYGSPSAAPAPSSLEEMLRQAQQQQPQLPPADPAEQQAFLQQTAGQPGVKGTGSGLLYRVISSGPASGATPNLGDEVKVRYKGTLSNGTEFDASDPNEPSVFKVGDLVPGFNEALLMMRPGDKWMIYIPAQLGYGAEGRGPIPGGSALVFELEMIEVLPQGGAVQTG